MGVQPRTASRAMHRELVGIALPAFGALVAEPLFLLADSAIIGHLGTSELAALGAASAVLLNAVLLCVFLSYGTAAIVARRAGSGDVRAALTEGLQGIWLAAGIGVVLGGVGMPSASLLVALFGVSDQVAADAVTYLRISMLGMPSMLMVLAATGVMRGLKNTRTPLLVTGVAALANALLNILLVYPVGLGIAGSAWGTVLAQTGAAFWLAGIVFRGARSHGTSLLPRRAGILLAARAGGPLLVRTGLLRTSLLCMTFVATTQGDVALASHQIAWTLWFLLSIPPEAFAIAGQAMVGHAFGAGDHAGARAIACRAIRWGLGTGLVAACLLVFLRGLYIPLFTTDVSVRTLLSSLAIVVAATQPVGAAVYVLDAILIATGDARYLAWTMLVASVVFLPLAGAVLATGAGVVALWWALVGWLLARLVTITVRYRSGAWLRADMG